ncbi:hypothetical protein K501DRAFT_332478 [Backusella circina FSU 941]|nr:hypothetical protein K501DRAFT_332478 [Backusella circina FSU 941]
MNFEDYFKYTALQSEIIQHTQHGKDGLASLLSDFYNVSDQNQLFSLDTIHKTLKHQRSCPDQEQCIVDEYIMEAFDELIFERVSAPVTFDMSEYTMAVCVCLIDLLKQDPDWDRDQSRDAVTFVQKLFMSESYSVYVYRKALSINKYMIAMDINIEMIKDVINTTCTFLQKCRHQMTLQDSSRIASEEYTEFFYTPFDNFTCDRECLKIAIQTIVDIFSYLAKTNQEDVVEKESYWIELIQGIKVLYQENKSTFIQLLFNTCCVGDDDTVQLLTAILEIYQLLPVNSKDSSIRAMLETIDINPHVLFLHFLHQCGNTHSIIVDLLLEDDSNFLLFFYSYIKYTLTDIQVLKTSLSKVQGINVNTLHFIFTNTLRVIRGGAFPYNTKPLVNRLEQLLLCL